MPFTLQLAYLVEGTRAVQRTPLDALFCLISAVMMLLMTGGA